MSSTHMFSPTNASLWLRSYAHTFVQICIHTRIDRGYGSQSVVPSGGKKSAAALVLKK